MGLNAFTCLKRSSYERHAYDTGFLEDMARMRRIYVNSWGEESGYFSVYTLAKIANNLSHSVKEAGCRGLDGVSDTSYHVLQSRIDGSLVDRL